MIVSYKLKKEQLQERLNLKSTEQAFTRQIVNGTDCSPFESEIIVEKAKEIFALGEYAEGKVLQDGQTVFIAVATEAPSGVPIEQCPKVRVVLTHLSRSEDLALILDCDVRTIRAVSTAIQDANNGWVRVYSLESKRANDNLEKGNCSGVLQYRRSGPATGLQRLAGRGRRFHDPGPGSDHQSRSDRFLLLERKCEIHDPLFFHDSGVVFHATMAIGSSTFIVQDKEVTIKGTVNFAEDQTFVCGTLTENTPFTVQGKEIMCAADSFVKFYDNSNLQTCSSLLETTTLSVLGREIAFKQDSLG